MNDRLFARRLFVRVARRESFSAAARELGVSQPTASRLVAALEKEVGITLLSRSTRAVSLTTAGHEYLARLEPLLAALDDAEQAARGVTEVRGNLRVAAPLSLALREIIPRLPKFMARNPSLRLDFVLDDARQNLVREGFDVAIRIGPLETSSATARRLGHITRILAASPSYLERAGTPASPAELTNHDVVQGPISAGADAWVFRRGGRTLSVRVAGRVKTSLNEGAVAAAVAGLGIISTGSWGCRAEIANGSLVRILAEWSMEGAPVHALFPAGRGAKAAAKAFAEYLGGEFVASGP
jgi:DNA-binding transcriptional LysR family regulator